MRTSVWQTPWELLALGRFALGIRLTYRRDHLDEQFTLARLPHANIFELPAAIG